MARKNNMNSKSTFLDSAQKKLHGEGTKKYTKIDYYFACNFKARTTKCKIKG